MGEPRIPASLSRKLRELPRALLNDLPWGKTRSRATAFFSLALAGLAAGALQGWVLLRWANDGNWLRGDAFVWDSIEYFAWIGFAVGISGGTALALSRNFFVRVTLGGLLGI